MSEVNEIEIKLLPFPLNVRTRPSTYVGGLENPNNILREVIDNALDESYSSYCNKIFIETNFEKTGFNVVADNGRGLPIKMSSDIEGQTQAEVATSSLHAGSKFRLAGDNQTDASIGMNGLKFRSTN